MFLVSSQTKKQALRAHQVGTCCFYMQRMPLLYHTEYKA